MADIAGVMQTVLNDEELSSYYHFDQMPERRPLIIVMGATHIPDSPVEIQGEPVRFDDGRGVDRQAGNFIQVTRLIVDTNLALVEIAFPAEGVTGLYFLSRTGGTWHTEHGSLAEN